MNLKEHILQNEILHLGQIIQTLSYELIVLQDFLKEEHGPKFEEFRSRVSADQEDQVPLLTKSSAAVEKYEAQFEYEAKRGRPRKDDNYEIERISAENPAIRRLQEGEEMPPKAYNECINSSSVSEVINYDSDMDISEDTDSEAEALRDPLNDGNQKGGRKRTKIWKYFDTIHLNRKRASVRCHLCKRVVSARATRMVEHRIKCKRRSLVNRGIQRPSDADRETLAQLQDCRDDESTEDVSELGAVDSGKSTMDISATANENESDNRAQVCENSRAGNRSSPIGRGLSIIWSYFEISYHNKLRKAKCLSCGQLVSPKAERMRQHKSICAGSGKTPAGDSAETLSSASVFSEQHVDMCDKLEKIT